MHKGIAASTYWLYSAGSTLSTCERLSRPCVS
jgi:hypothetical protein